MDGSFFAGAYWGSRKETLDMVSKRTYKFIKRISSFSTEFSEWYMLGMNRKEALKNKITMTEEFIKELYLMDSKNTDMADQGQSTAFFSLGLWNGKRDEEASNLNFTLGGEFKTKNISNCCVLKLPFEGSFRDWLIKFENAKQLLELFIDEWNPDFARFSSYNLSKRLSNGKKLGWITYWNHESEAIMNNVEIISENVNSGQLFYLKLGGEFSYTEDSINKMIRFEEELRP